MYLRARDLSVTQRTAGLFLHTHKSAKCTALSQPSTVSFQSPSHFYTNPWSSPTTAKNIFFWGFEISLVVLFFPQISLAAVDITISLVHPAKRLVKNYANTLMDEEDHLKTKHIKPILAFYYMNMKTRWSFSFPYCSSQITIFFSWSDGLLFFVLFSFFADDYQIYISNQIFGLIFVHI